MKGYPTDSGYKGYIPNEGYVLFATEEDYKEYYIENYIDMETN
jgi:hypothetical protein